MKDLFSMHSDQYAQFRPEYPEQLIQYISSLASNQDNAWDCATGNGQFAKGLADNFKNVFASDISEKQLANAIQFPNIHYSLQSAENCNFKNSFFDLIVVAQAVHWFDFDCFFSEVKRTLKADGVIAITGYGLFKCEDKIDKFILDFYQNKIGKYWDPERKFIDEKYKTIPFPFREITTPLFEMKFSRSFDQLIGYLKTWSAVNNFRKENQREAIDEDFILQLKKLWGNDTVKEIRFPLFLRAGKLQ